ncbi:flagellar hook-basal body complex protein [Candidatus Dependentiae bacterium]|nr:flagellar hook-basal body complex protein [Candidatus Dependentiae bacterium]
MMRGLWSGVSGLQSHQLKMDVIGDNIANINTTAFKKTDVVFTDFMSQLMQIAHGPEGETGGTGPQQIGLGTTVGSITRDTRQGSMQRTDRTLDCAVQGSGYFVIKDGNAQYYTRNGHFELDAAGTLCYAPGLKVQGWQAELDPVTGEYRVNTTTKSIEDIQIKVGDVIPAKATTSVQFSGNLNSQSEMAIEPMVLEWSTGDNGAVNTSKVKIEFEHTHPTEPYYIWRATWAENPPAGYKVGDDVLDANTGRAAEGIIKLDSNGKVIGSYINTNAEGVVNASIPVSSSTNGPGNIGLSKVDVRNQFNASSAQWKVEFDQDDTTKYRVFISTDNGSTWSTLPVPGKDANNADLTNNIGDVTTNCVFTYVTGAGTDRKMYGQVTILASDWTGEASKGDTIVFSTSASDTTAEYNQLLNLPTERPKAEDDWPSIVASLPIAANTNDEDSGSLLGVSLNSSVKIDTATVTGSTTPTWDAANLVFNPANPNDPHVMVDGFVNPAVQYRIKIEDVITDVNNINYSVIDRSTNQVMGTGKIGAGNPSFNAFGIYIPQSAWDSTNVVAGSYVDFTTTQISPAPANYRITFNTATTYTLSKTTDGVNWTDLVTNQSVEDDLDFEKGIKSATAYFGTDDGGTDDVASIGNETIKIPWSNWAGVFQANDSFYFSTHKSVSEQPGHRDFFRVKDSSGWVTEIFIPSGSLTGADPITFTPNTTESATAGDTAFQYEYDGGSAYTGIALGGNPVTTTMNNVDEYQYVANIDVYDSLGKAHNLPVTFERKSTNLWMWSIKDPTPDDPNNVSLAGYGLIAFKADGTYDPGSSLTFKSEVGLNTPSPTGPVDIQGIYFDPSDWGGAPLPGEGANPNFITPDFNELVQYASTSDAELYSQNGYSKGTLTEFAIDAFGMITGLYDNGYSRDIAQIALANFNNEGGLLKQGGSLYRVTSNSGNPRIGVAGTGGRGAVASGNLEQSNVDLAMEFTTMITTQRGFQANSRTIQTEDQMIQELLSLKR